MKGIFLTVYRDVSPATDSTNDWDVFWPWDRAAAVWADFIPEQQFKDVCFARIHY